MTAPDPRDLLAHVQQLDTAPASTTGITGWLSRALDGGPVHLIHPYENPAVAGQDLDVPADRITALIEGRTPVDVRVTADHVVHLRRVGPGPPYAVLAAGHLGGWPPAAEEHLVLVLRILGWWLGRRGTEEAARSQVRDSLLQLLMTAQVDTARRVAHGMHISPAAMAAEEVCVHIIGGDPAARARLTAAANWALGADGFAVGCPVDHGEIIAVTTLQGATILRDLVAAHPHHHLGSSRLVKALRVATGHSHATCALAEAAIVPGLYARYRPETDPVLLLPAEPARCWAWQTLEPLFTAGWDPGFLASTLNLLRRRLLFGAVGAAAIVGLHRNTVTNRLADLEGLLRLDLDVLPEAARLDLALRISDQHSDQAPADPTGPVPDLDDLLMVDAARTWADGLLRRLGDPVLDRTVRVWMRTGRDTAATAVELGVASRTVQHRLRRAAGLLRRPLKPGGAASANGISGAHDVWFAVRILDLAETSAVGS